MGRDRDLLLAVAAVARGFVGPESILELGPELVSQPDGSLGAILVERGWLSSAELDALEAQVEARLSGDRDGRPTPAVEPPGEGAARPFAGPSMALGSTGGATTDPASDGTALVLPSTVDAEATTVAGRERWDGAWSVPHGELADPPRSRERYPRGRLLERGGMGEVWLVHDEHLGRDVVLKFIRPDRRGASLPGRFVREAKVSGRLEHPNIVTVHEFAHDGRGGIPFYTMRQVRGRTLSKAIRQHHAARKEGRAGRVELVGLLEAFVTVCRAVDFAHKAGVLHRDLKPANIALGDFGEVIVLDWGLAKIRGASKEEGAGWIALGDLQAGSDATLDGTILGTLPYMPPEQARGAGDQVSPRGDVYSLGVILYELLTDRKPFAGPARADYLRQITTEAPAPPRQHEPSAPAALAAVCLKAMAREPEGRYAGAGELADEVRRWLADEPVAAYRDPIMTRLRRAASRHRTAVAAAGVLVATAVVALAVGYVVVRGERDATELARQAAVDAEDRARASQARAELSRDVAGSVASGLLVAVADVELNTLPGVVAVRRRVADRAATIYERALARNVGDEWLSYEAAQIFRHAANLRRMVDDLDESRALHERAIGLLKGLVAKRPAEALFRDRLAEALRDAAETVLRARGPKAAEPLLRESLALATRLRRDFPGRPEFARTEAHDLLEVGEVEIGDGRFAQAATDLGLAAKVLVEMADRPGRTGQPTDPIIAAMALANLADADRRLGRESEARAAAEDAVRRGRTLVAAPSPLPDSRAVLALALVVRARLQASVPESVEAAIHDFDEAAALCEELRQSNPQITYFRRRLALIEIERGRLLADSGQPDAAMARAMSASQLLGDLEGDAPGAEVYKAPMAATHALLGRLALDRGELGEARRELERARSLLGDAPEGVEARETLGRVLDDLERLDRRPTE